MPAPVATAELLRAVPIFSSLPSAALKELAARASHVSVRAGEYLFHQGDPPDSLYIVSSGRLEVVLVDPSPVVARVVVRGAVLGELGVLTGSPRSASVRAKRDSELIAMRRDDFAGLLEEPRFSADLARALGRELQASRGVASEVNPVPTTIAIVALAPNLPAMPICDRLSQSLAGFGPAGVMHVEASEGGDDASFARLLDEHERRHDQVLLVAETTDPPSWQDFCVRQADRVLVLMDRRTPPSEATRRPELRGCDLVCCESAGTVALGRWLDGLQPRAVYAVSLGPTMDDQIGVIGRRLTGHSVGVVLSGGGARGSAHIGVFAELAASGVIVDRVVGCSIGALAAAAFAAGMEPDEMAARWQRNMVETNPLNDYTFPAVSLLRGTKLMDGLRDLFGTTQIEDLSREFFCVSSDLHAGELYVHRRGPVVDAVYASMCIPGLLPPAMVDGRVLVDGGVLNNLPVDTMASRGEGPVVAVNLTIQQSRPKPGAAERPEPDRARRWATAIQAAVTGVEGPAPRLRETLMRVLLLGSVDATRLAQEQADVVIVPDTRGIGLLQFDKLGQGVEAGRAATRDVLASQEARKRLFVR